MRKRKMFMIAGSLHDGPQLPRALQAWSLAIASGAVESFAGEKFTCGSSQEKISQEITVNGDGFLILSVHRNPVTLGEFLRMLTRIADADPETDYMLVMSAGWAAQLAPIADSRLRHEFHSKNIFVVATALEAPKLNNDSKGATVALNSKRSALEIVNAMTDRQLKEVAAILSLIALPDTCIIHSDDKGVFFGEKGVVRAVEFAARGKIPEEIRQKVKDPTTKPPEFLPLEDAIQKFNGGV